MKKIIYEPHPVTPERKAELIAQGYKIVDAAFAPESEKTKQEPKSKAKTKQEQKDSQDKIDEQEPKDE